MADRFRRQGFHQLDEREPWSSATGQSSFVIREDGALIAFAIGSTDYAQKGFRMLGAHSDSPCLQIKPLPDISAHGYRQLGVEVYGGALLHPWFDRPLSLAGRVCCRMRDDTLRMLLVDFKRPLLTIPSLAIHFDREANKSHAINAQQHLTPLFSQGVSETLPDFNTVLLEQIAGEHPDQEVTEIAGFDLFCYDSQPPCTIGYKDEFISGSRLDNLASCFVGMRAMLEAGGDSNRLFICNNHEEIGSTSATGALGSLPLATLERLIPNAQSRQICLSRSFLISMDNAHAVHPNFADKSDAAHPILLNHGPVIKMNANQRYATNSLSKAIYQQLAKEVSVPTQEFVMRNDMACGSTIGPLLASRLGVRTVDIGVPSLAMHSIRELTGSRDPHLLLQTILHFLCREQLPGESG